MLDSRVGSCNAQIGDGYTGIKGEVSVHAPFFFKQIEMSCGDQKR